MSRLLDHEMAVADAKDVPPVTATYDTHIFDSGADTIENPENIIAQPAKSSWVHLFAFTRSSHAASLIAALIASGLTAGLKTVLAVVLGKIFDVIGGYGLGKKTSNDTLSGISQWSVILVGIGIGNWLASAAFLGLWIAFGELQATSVRHAISHSLLSKDMAWFDSQEQGISSLLVRIQTQTRELQLATSQVFGLLACDTMTALASLGIALYYSWKLTLVLLVTFPISATILFFATKPLESAIQAQRRDLAAASKHATAAVTAIDLVKAFNGHEQELWQYYQPIQKAAGHYMIQARCNSIQMGYVAFWIIFIFVVGFWYGVALVEDGLSPGSVLTTFYATLATFQGIEALMPHWLVLAKGMSAGAFLQAITRNSLGDKKKRKMGRTVRPDTCAGDIELTNVSFAYPSNPKNKVLQQSSLFFPAGDMTFIVGRSGSGKSTIGNLIANFYEPLTGDIQIDGKSICVLDDHWVRENVTLIQQTSILFNDTLFKNVAFGHRDPDSATSHEIQDACDAAILQSTIAGLPQGLETNVGFDGHDFSGGQKQRLALARARLRDPPVLILDEVTSGLDQVSRSLVMGSIRQWRRGKTTIIITHDASQIEDGDFVYVMNSSYIVQEGFKRDLMKEEEGHFAFLASPHDDNHDPGCPQINVIPPDSPDQMTPDTPIVRSRSTRMADFLLGELESGALHPGNPRSSKRASLGAGAAYALRLRSDQAWDAAGPPQRVPSFRVDENEDWGDTRRRFSRYLTQSFSLSAEEPRPESNVAPSINPSDQDTISRQPSQSHQKSVSAPYLSATDAPSRRFSVRRSRSSRHYSQAETQEQSILLENVSPSETTYVGSDSTFHVADRQIAPTDMRDEETDDENVADETSSSSGNVSAQHTKRPKKRGSVLTTIGTVWPTIGVRHRVILILGVIACIIGAAATPAFAYCFAQLLGVMTTPGDKVQKGIKWASIMLATAILDGAGWGSSRYLLEQVAQTWVNNIRTEALRRIILQPKSWFGKSKNSPGRINECLDRNAEEMRNIVGKFIPIIVAVFTMISMSVIWALIVSWKLSLVAMAPLPVVMASIKGFAIVSSKWEGRCNKAAETTSATITEIFLNIRVVRALTLETYFTNKYEGLVADTLKTGFKRAAYTSGPYGLYHSMGYALTALIFYYGTVLLADKNELSVANVMQVVNLLLFSIGTATGILSSIPQLTMAQATALQMLEYANMPTRPPEGQRGQKKLGSPLPVRMNELQFSYSRHSKKPVLKRLSLDIYPGKCTAIVGHSGCGKSTLVSILMGLYVPKEPATLTFAGVPSSEVDISYLHSKMAYVSQSPFLFPASIADNITYGLADDSLYRQTNSICRAADAAGLHDWIVSLPEGYNTLVGNGGQSLSGGQAQRLSIARALVRRPSLLVLDEPTSALDAESAEIIRQTIRDLVSRGGDMAVVLVTHSREMMKVADWIVMLGEGGVVTEQGTYGKLWDKRGQFAKMVSGGEIE